MKLLMGRGATHGYAPRPLPQPADNPSNRDRQTLNMRARPIDPVALTSGHELDSSTGRHSVAGARPPRTGPNSRHGEHAASLFEVVL